MTRRAAVLASLRQQELLEEARSNNAWRAARSSRPQGGARPGGLPLFTKLGVVLIVSGVLAELLIANQHHAEEHLGHLVVLLGMVLALVGIVIRGIRIRFTTPNGEPSHAIR